MKELSIEEKAKRYDELKVTAQELEHDGCFDKITLFDLFPELEESEDERIRKVLVGWIKCEPLSSFEKGFSQEQILAWLEKQGEQKPVAKYKVGDTIYYDSFGRLVSFVIANIVEDGTDNPMYEDKDGNSVFQNDIIEQKPAWSEEDEKKRKGLIKGLEDRMGFGWTSDPFSREEYIDWLKSLRHRSTWKPSDEQMKVLTAISSKEILSGYERGMLVGLYTELQKLREE